MSRKDELIQLYQAQTAEEQAQAERKEQARQDAEHERLIRINLSLREKCKELLGDLFLEMAPPEPQPLNYVPLLFGPGPDKYLIFHSHNSRNGEYRLDGELWDQKLNLPADEAQIGALLLSCQRNRESDREKDLQDALLYFNRADAQQIMERWPELRAQIETALVEREQKQKARDEQRDARQEKQAAGDEQFIASVASDAVALALLKSFLAIQTDREKWQGYIESANWNAELAYESANKASGRARESENESRRADQERWDAENRAQDLERKLKQAKREAERG